uniref:Ig-like domain-containing protein n=1 Tax=Hymenolepis diminuta TaxID=6216 RepID=A0A158QE68_HYMDI
LFEEIMRNGAETLPHFREMVDRNANKNDNSLLSQIEIRTNGETSDHRLLEFEQPLENQVIHIDSTRPGPTHFLLICHLTQAERRAQVTWSYNGSLKLPLAQFNTSFDGKTARLSAKGLKPEYSGSYACEIRSPCGSSTAYTQCEVKIVPLGQPANTSAHPVTPFSNSHANRGQNQDYLSPQGNRYEYVPPGMIPMRSMVRAESLRVSTVPPQTPPPPPPPLPSLPPHLPTPPPPANLPPPPRFLRRQAADTTTDCDEDTLPTDNYSARASASRNTSAGRTHRYQSLSTHSDRVSLTPGEYAEMRTLSDIPGLPDDEELDDIDAVYEYLIRPRSQSRRRNRSWRRPASTYTEPRVILINAAPQHDNGCQSCCCSCHRSRCMYTVSDSGYSHEREAPRNKNMSPKRSTKRITFNPDPELCYNEDPVHETQRPVSICIPERISHEIDDTSNKLSQQPQAISCSRITQHATVKAPPNKRPDASWSSRPDKNLPKESEIQTPEAAAAAKAVIKKVLESRMIGSETIIASTKNKKPIPKALPKKTEPIPPVSNSKPMQNATSVEKKISEPMLPPVAHQMNNEANKVEERAAKERFMNALARFQISTSTNSEMESNKAPNGHNSVREPQPPLKYSEEVLNQTEKTEKPPSQPWRRRSFGNAKTFLQSSQVYKISVDSHENLQRHHISQQVENPQDDERNVLPTEHQIRENSINVTQIHRNLTISHNGVGFKKTPVWRTKSNGSLNSISNSLNETAPTIKSSFNRRDPPMVPFQQTTLNQPSNRPQEIKGYQDGEGNYTSIGVSEQIEAALESQTKADSDVSAQNQVRTSNTSNPITAYSERFGPRQSANNDIHSKWQQQRSKIFRNVSRVRSPSFSKRFSRREGKDFNEAISYPEEDDPVEYGNSSNLQTKNLTPFSPPSEIRSATHNIHYTEEGRFIRSKLSQDVHRENVKRMVKTTDPVVFLNDHFRYVLVALEEHPLNRANFSQLIHTNR